MATIDLGKLGFVNKGTYNNSTTYEKNDLVQFTDGGLLSTYLYIDSSAQSGQAPSSSGTAGSRWVFFAKGGAAGTDVAATLANKEISFKTNAGALDGVPIGSAGEFLKVNSGATGYEFGAVSADFVKLGTATASSSSTLAVNGFYDDTTYSSYKVVFDNIKFSANTYVAFRVQNATGILTSAIYKGATTAMSFPYYDNTGYYFDYQQNRYMTNYSNTSGKGGMSRFEVGLNNNTSDTKAQYYHDTNANMTGELMTNVTQATDRRKNWIGEVTFTNRYQNFTAHGMYRINMQVHDLTAHTGFVLVPMSGNIASGSLHLYGLKK